jgi:hypothetical protein
MSRLLEFILGSILIAVFTVAFLFFSAVHYILRGSGTSDCAWYGSARAWIDSNADGRPNPDEQPLSDVQIHVDHGQNQFFNIDLPVVTDRDGDVQLNVSIPGCSDTALEIYVDIPEGYRATTKPRIEVNLDLGKGLNIERVFYFGFAPEH